MDEQPSHRLERELTPEHPLDSVRRVLADSDSAAEQDDRWEREAEAQDRIQVAWGRTSVSDRLAAMTGLRIRAQVRIGTNSALIDAAVEDVGPGWVQLRNQAGIYLVNTSAIAILEGLTSAARDPQSQSAAARARGWTQVLRSLAGGRAVVVTLTDGQVLAGTIGRVGSDHADLICEGRAPTVAFAAIAIISVR